jgi:hypothetical protein
MQSKFILGKMKVNYICLQCKEKEEILYMVVRDYDLMDDGDPEVPPQFSCEAESEELEEKYQAVVKWGYPNSRTGVSVETM